MHREPLITCWWFGRASLLKKLNDIIRNNTVDSVQSCKKKLKITKRKRYGCKEM